MADLSRHGGACRCLLRLLENEGRPRLPDEAFIQRFQPLFPQWQEQPGVVDAVGVLDVARELGLAESLELSRDYDFVRTQHAAGWPVLMRTAFAPLQDRTPKAPRLHHVLLERIEADGFVVWCPFENGTSDELPRAAREWWDAWQTVAFVLHRRHTAP